MEENSVNMGQEINKIMNSVIEKNEKIKMNKYAKKMSEKEFELFTSFIYDNFGIHLTESKRHMLELKIQRLVHANGMDGYTEYYNMISNTKEREKIIDFLNEITINKTDFFREINHFNYIKNNIDLILKKNPRINITKEIRVWSAACSTGEEPYTLAMVLKEILPENIRIKILATDISHRALGKALTGKYGSEIKNQVDPIFLSKYFKKILDGYEVKNEIKDLISFRSFNLKSTFPFKHGFDIIFCRNVMIYFDKSFQEILVDKFYTNTVRGGLFFIGHSESLTYIKNRYKYVQPTIYTRD